MKITNAIEYEVESLRPLDFERIKIFIIHKIEYHLRCEIAKENQLPINLRKRRFEFHIPNNSGEDCGDMSGHPIFKEIEKLYLSAGWSYAHVTTVNWISGDFRVILDR